jgi:hypothetical protein
MDYLLIERNELFFHPMSFSPKDLAINTLLGLSL